jgi:hypothetical protein
MSCNVKAVSKAIQHAEDYLFDGMRLILTGSFICLRAFETASSSRRKRGGAESI